MSNENTQKWAQEQKMREKAELRSGSGYATCLHCGNSFRVTKNVVTPDAAICDVCNDSD
jgi:hypothetical protein